MKAAEKSTFLFLLLLIFGVGNLFAQTTTRNGGSTTTTNASKKPKILVIPWEPRMFNCNPDISRAISYETSQKYDQIQEALRRGMVEKLKAAFGANYNVISLIDDTAKMKADLHYVYTCTSMSYTPVNFPLNPTKADSAKLKAQSGVSKGQVTATTDETDKFMNTVVLSPNLLAYLKKKYGAEYVIFINEVDLDNDLAGDPLNLEHKDDFKRTVVMHWTIFNSTDGKRVAMGKNKTYFSSMSNTPKKIIDGAFPGVANAMYTKFAAAVKPKE
jgi:hypothetical protein